MNTQSRLQIEHGADPTIRKLVEHMNYLQDQIDRQRISSVRGGRLRMDDGGAMLTIDRSRAAAAAADDAYPFKLQLSPIGGVLYKLQIEPGTIGGVVPTLGGVPLSNSAAFWNMASVDLPVDVWAKLSFDIDTGDGTYLYSAVLVTAVIQLGSLPPSSTGASGYRVPLGVIQNGAVTGQYVRTSLSVRLCDDNTGTGNGILYTSRS